MLYHSTNSNSEKVNFREATIRGQAPDKGLYFPDSIPMLTKEFLYSFKQKSKAQIAFEVIGPYVGDMITEENLFQICEHTVNFDFPLYALRIIFRLSNYFTDQRWRLKMLAQGL